MLSFEYKLKDPMGLHARPVAQLLKEIKKYNSKVSIAFGDKTVDVLHMIAVMQLGAKQDDIVKFIIEGADEQEVQDTLKRFLVDNL